MKHILDGIVYGLLRHGNDTIAERDGKAEALFQRRSASMPIARRRK